ncbi:hypothetical protein VSDG_04873 [Cytospora chrysosperma]|uniref:MYND-type domain-containing protein n=1 Tax=Cytospora chrysosperma TaxID=252740 RepID=A0A423W3R3_CYTCH|nr:hypothetical protein VSDG_04873 [Valsa sordida]
MASFYNNITAIPPGTNPNGLLEAIQKNNAASLATQAGRHDEAIALHREALAAKVRDHGDESVHAALSFNSLGESYLAVGRLREAGECFAEAAREIRLKGADKGQTMCGCEDCSTPGGAMLTWQKLKACGACRSVFYCSAACQKKDWTSRHKPLCKRHTTSRTSTSSTG